MSANEAPTSAGKADRPSRLRRFTLGCGALLLVIVAVLAVLIARLDQPLPDVRPSAEADALAREMMAAVNIDAWHRTGAIAWDFGGRQQHLWDRHRQFARVRYGDGNEVLIDLSTQEGRAYSGGNEVAGEEAIGMVAAAWAFWCNDSFWLNPVAKLFDEGTSRALVEAEQGGRPGVLVTYSLGGVTPGDSYLWEVGEDGKPTAWKMWTQIIPIGGVGASWGGWIELPTGALVATKHQARIFDLHLTEIHAASDLEALAATGAVPDLEPNEDPFAPLVEPREAL